MGRGNVDGGAMRRLVVVVLALVGLQACSGSGTSTLCGAAAKFTRAGMRVLMRKDSGKAARRGKGEFKFAKGNGRRMNGNARVKRRVHIARIRAQTARHPHQQRQDNPQRRTQPPTPTEHFHTQRKRHTNHVTLAARQLIGE